MCVSKQMKYVLGGDVSFANIFSVWFKKKQKKTKKAV